VVGGRRRPEPAPNTLTGVLTIQAPRRDDALRVAGVVGVYLFMLSFAAMAIAVLAPAQLQLTVAGRAIALGRLHDRVLAGYLVLSLVVPALILLELAVVGWRRSSLRRLVIVRRPSSMSDLTCFIVEQTPLMSLLRTVSSLGVILVSAQCLHGLIERAVGVDLSVANQPLAAQVALYFLVYSFFDYWSHRLDHSALFWPLHRYHHAVDEFCIVSSVRVHPAAFTRILQQALPAALLGASPEAVASVNFAQIVYRYVIHSNVDSNFGWIGRYLLQSPTHHRLHHSLAAGAHAGHFGLVPIWDHLFGTWRGEATQSLPIGVETPYRHGIWLFPDLWRDYCDFWRGLAAPLTALVRRTRVSA